MNRDCSANHTLLNCSLRSIFDIIHRQLDLCHLIDKGVLKEGNAAEKDRIVGSLEQKTELDFILRDCL